jgi:HTH-type transcriptional regulator/antitoxin HigA
MRITKQQYEYALARIEELLPLVDDKTPTNDKNAIELSIVSEMVIAYETEHYPMSKPTVNELIKLSLEEQGLTQKEAATMIGVSPTRMNDFVSGKSLPSLPIASKLCVKLGISPALMLGI